MLQESAVEFTEYLFVAPDPLTRSAGIYPVFVGQNKAKPNYKVGPRQIENYNIHFVMDGMVSYHSNGVQVQLSKGDMFCKFPFVTHTYHIVPSDSLLRMKWITFNGPQAELAMSLIGMSPDKPYRRKVVDPHLDVLLQRILETSRSGGSKQIMMLLSLMLRLFSSLMPEQEQLPTSALPAEWVQKALDFMQTYYAEKINVSDIAGYVGIHRTHFSKTFAAAVGMPPIQYLQTLRLNKAKQLLRQSAMTVTETALTVGYPDLFSFTRAFTKQFGIAPSHYREAKEL